MDERQLRAFLAILDSGSLSKAADRLGYAQPSLSQLLRRLEDELGSRLFERTSHGVVPTPAGALFRDRAISIIADLERAREELSGQRALEARQTRIGIPPPLMALFSQTLLSRLEQTVPLSSVAFREGTSDDVKAWLEDGAVDFALLYNVEDMRNALVRPVFGDELMLISRRDDSLPLDDLGILDDPIDLGTADNHPLILAERHNGMRRFIENACRREGVQIRPTYTVNSLHLVRELLLMGHGHAILPPTLLTGDTGLMGRRISRPDLKRVIFVVRNVAAAAGAHSLEVEAAVLSAMDWMIRERRWFATPIDYADL